MGSDRALSKSMIVGPAGSLRSHEAIPVGIGKIPEGRVDPGHLTRHDIVASGSSATFRIDWEWAWRVSGVIAPRVDRL